MEGNTGAFDYVAEHQKATRRLNDLMAEYIAVKRVEREVRIESAWKKFSKFKFLIFSSQS